MDDYWYPMEGKKFSRNELWTNYYICSWATV